MIKVFSLVFAKHFTGDIMLHVCVADNIGVAMNSAFDAMRKQSIAPNSMHLVLHNELVIDAALIPKMEPVKSPLLDKVGLMNHIIKTKDERILEANLSKFSEAELNYLRDEIKK